MLENTTFQNPPFLDAALLVLEQPLICFYKEHLR